MRKTVPLLQEHAQCAVTLVGSDRAAWEEQHRPYLITEIALQSLADHLPDGSSVSIVTEYLAVVRCLSRKKFCKLAVRAPMLPVTEIEAAHGAKNSNSDSSTGTVAVLCPRLALLTSYVPVRDLQMADSLARLTLAKCGAHSLTSQVVFCLVVTDGDRSASVEDQHRAVHAAATHLAARVPATRSAVFAHVDLATLGCTTSDLAAVAGTVADEGPKPKMSATEEDDKAPQLSLPANGVDNINTKRETWRKLMDTLPASAVDFLVRLTYPCLVVTSPCLQAGERSLLAAPRSLLTLCPVTRKCLFSASTIVTAVQVFLQEVLWQLDSSAPSDHMQHPALSSWIVI
jgi:hypothetical protein